MSRESRRQRGALHEMYKAQREAKYEGRKKAKKHFTKNYKVDQKKVGEAIAALAEYYGKDFKRSAYTSEELLDIYEKIFVSNEKFPDLNESERDEVNRKLNQSGIPIQIKEATKPKLAVDLTAIRTKLQTEFPW